MLLNRANYVLPEIPSYAPVLTPNSQYTQFWKGEKRKIYEGYWSSGMWCPPQLYFYLNFWTIKLSETVNSKNKKYAQPFFREIEWEKAYVYSEAIGFSGFADDELVTCHRKVLTYDPEYDSALPLECYRKDGTLKEYKPARDYLPSFFPRVLGKPLYQNEARNVADVEAREGGKSYWASALIGHNWLTDGYTDYDRYLADVKTGVLDMSETLVGAIDTKFSSDLMGKVEVGLSMLPGETTDLNGRKIPSPLSKQYTGSFKPGNNPVKAYFKQPVAGGWKDGGSGSLIHHRGFNDNPLAGNGTRPGRIFLEEVGFMGNLLDALGSLRDCTTVSGVKFGTIYMMGTGGAMKGGATEAIQTVFYNPEEFDCLSYPDHWEQSGRSIGYFVPPYRFDIEFLDKTTGKIDEVKALRKLEVRRTKLKQGKDKTALHKELENKPLVPSEAFLTISSNKFPVAELKDQLGMVLTSTDPLVKGTLGTLVRNQEGKLEFKPDLNNSIRMPDYPIRRGDNDKSKNRDTETEGGICLWKFPTPGVVYGLYSSGLDPFSKDDAPNSVSLGSLFVIERGSIYNDGFDRIVAEYTGRPDTSDLFYEGCKNLIEFFHSHECLYESNVKDFKGYLQNRNALHLLALTPGIMQNTVKNSESQYGIYIGNDRPKREVENYLDGWLRKKATAEGKLHLHFIYSPGLLKELIAYNKDGNFDRVIAAALAVVQAAQLETVELKPQKEQVPSVFAGRKFFTNHPSSGYSHRSSPPVRKPQHVFLPPNGR